MKNKPKNKRWILYVFIIFLIIMYFTNPTLEEYSYNITGRLPSLKGMEFEGQRYWSISKIKDPIIETDLTICSFFSCGHLYNDKNGKQIYLKEYYFGVLGGIYKTGIESY